MFNISNLPIELTKKIFCECLDEETQLKCFDISKRINWLVSTHLLSNLQIPVSDNPTPYCQLMKYYKKHCRFFQVKLPLSIPSVFSTTITAKHSVDNALSESDNSGVNTMLNEAWRRFLHQIQPATALFSHIRPEEDCRFNDTLTSNPNEEAQMFIRAGASRLYPESFETIISRDWCTKETVSLLLNYNFKVTTGVILSAIRKNFNEILPDLLKTVKEENLSLNVFCKNVGPAYESLVEKYYVDRASKVAAYEIRGALEGDYSEKFISKLLTKCNKGIDSSHVKLALEAKYSEDLVLDFLRKSYEGVQKWHIALAIEGAYSSYLIEAFANKLQEGHSTSYRNVYDAVEGRYPENTISILLEKIDTHDLKNVLDFFLAKGIYPNLVEKYLPELKENFNRWAMRGIIMNGCPEGSFLKIFDKTDQSLSINTIYLCDVISKYSPETVELLLNKGIKVYISDVTFALEKKLPEKILSRMIEKVKYVELADIKTARRLSYSPELIKQMQAKCSTSECAIV